MMDAVEGGLGVDPSPLVSIGMPVFNGENYLAEAVESILGQTFQDLELIIADNASTDGTPDLCHSFAKRDKRVRYYRFAANGGAALNYNRCVALARGRYFKWAAHDDVCEPAFIERCVEEFRAGPTSVVIVYPKSRFIDEQSRPLDEYDRSMDTSESSPHRRVARVVSTVNMAHPVFGLFRIDALRRTRLIDSFIASDYVLLVEVALLGQIHEVPETLFLRRAHPRMSRVANKTRSEVAGWFDPTIRTRRLHLPTRWRLLIEYGRSVHRLIPDRRERLMCYASIVLTYAERRVRVVGGRYRRIFSDS
jgi:glycosyltransferase involved in cell wall biosynthesis